MPVYQNKKTKLWKFRTYTEDLYGQRRQFQKSGFRTKKEAIQAEMEFINKSKNGCCNMNFSELWEIYEKHIELKLKYNSYRTIKTRVEKHILPYFKDYKLEKINAAVYTRWQKIMEDKGYSYKYKSSMHGAIRTMFNYAIKFYGLETNIASKVGNFSKRNEIPKQPDVWSYEEFKKFIDVVDNEMYKLFFETLYYTGIRKGECLALTWNDLQGKYLYINKTMTRQKIDGVNQVNSPKTTTSHRKVKITDKLLLKLNAYKERCHKFVGFENSWYIFGCLKPLATTTVARKKDLYCEKAGVKKIKIHDFRHSHVSLLLSKNVPITVIAERLGHSDKEITLNTYSHMLPGDENKAVDALENLE